MPCQKIPPMGMILNSDPIPAGASDHRLGPVYEGKSLAAMIDMITNREIEHGSKVLYAHLGGQPALNAYSALFG